VVKKYGRLEKLEINLNLKFWKNKKILITGSNGFKGSWLVMTLKLLGAQVYGLGLRNTNQINFYKQINLNKYLVEQKIIDIRNKKKLNNYIKNVNPDIIFHLAAQSLVRRSYREPELTLHTNILGTINLLEVSKTIKNLKIVLIVTTDKVYENNEKNFFFNEKDALGGDDIYSASKSSVELIVNAYNKSFFFKNNSKKIVTVRAGNVIGGGDWSKDRIIPDLVHAIKKKKSLILRYPNSVRPWQHVLEPLTGYIFLVEKLMTSKKPLLKKINFGPKLSNHVKVRRIVNLFQKKIKTKNHFLIKKSKLPESKNLFLDSSYAKKVLNFKPILNLKETINLTADWYKSYLDREDLEKKTVRQILLYLKRRN
jgi:CDP-glucose 4,6-dehydratase